MDNKSIIHTEWLACPYCDTLHERLLIKKGDKLKCRYCGSVIDKGVADFRRAFSLALTAFILFIIANNFPFITMNLQGEINTISVFSSIRALFDNGLPVLGVLVLLVIIIMPLWYLSAVLWVIISFRFHVMSGVTRRFLHWMSWMSPWNMLEVYLAGVIVTMVKILTMAEIEFEPGFWAFCALMVCSILVNNYFYLDDAIFTAYEHDPD